MGPRTAIVLNDQVPSGTSGQVYRVIDGIDPARLRLFFLSLLWRAAATERHEFQDVSLSPAHLSELGRMLLTNNPVPLEFYPTVLCQLSSRGVEHNHVPKAVRGAFPNLPGLGHQVYPIFRFYFDGLVVHIHRQTNGVVRKFGHMVVGAGATLCVATVPYEKSFQRDILNECLFAIPPKWLGLS